MLAILLWLKALCEYLGGSTDQPPLGFPLSTHSVWWGLWWALLLCVLTFFCGQTTKFIYIDF